MSIKKTAIKAARKLAAKQAAQKSAAGQQPDMPEIRRPESNPAVPPLKVGEIADGLNKLKADLELYAAHLRALDRKRLNGVGIKKQGFVQRARDIAMENQEFFPHYLTMLKFDRDNSYFLSFRMMVDAAQQIRELLWNITIEASDVVYTDALEYYASVREAAKRRVDAAESLYAELSLFFKSRGFRPNADAASPTAKKIRRDVNALLRGKRDGKIVVEHIKPKAAGGVHKVVDEHFTEDARFKETEQGEIKE
jgi:hypothetical protein